MNATNHYARPPRSNSYLYFNPSHEQQSATVIFGRGTEVRGGKCPVTFQRTGRCSYRLNYRAIQLEARDRRRVRQPPATAAERRSAAAAVLPIRSFCATGSLFLRRRVRRELIGSAHAIV